MTSSWPASSCALTLVNGKCFAFMMLIIGMCNVCPLNFVFLDLCWCYFLLSPHYLYVLTSVMPTLQYSSPGRLSEICAIKIWSLELPFGELLPHHVTNFLVWPSLSLTCPLDLFHLGSISHPESAYFNSVQWIPIHYAWAFFSSALFYYAYDVLPLLCRMHVWSPLPVVIDQMCCLSLRI